jgi:hypothetical protein
MESKELIENVNRDNGGREAPVVRNFRDIAHAIIWMGDALDWSFNGEKLDEGNPLGLAAILRVLGAEALRLDEHLDNGGKHS